MTQPISALRHHHDLLLETKSLLHVSTTGSGPSLLKSIWDSPGSSAYFVGCFVPYSRIQLHGFLGHPPDDSYISEAVAYDMAMASYIRASEHKAVEGAEGEPVGLGVTSAVASSRLPRGEQRAHIALITKNTVNHAEVQFEKDVGVEARQKQDAQIAETALKLLRSVLEGWTPSCGKCQEKALERFYRYPVFHTNGTRVASADTRVRGLYLPATLNPIHEGHRLMARLAEDYLAPEAGRVKASYLVSAISPHKGRLEVQDMLYKAGMLRAERWRTEYESRMVEFTHDEPLFIDKARKRPESTFVIGADTMKRLLDPSWGPPIEEMLNEMKNLKIQFLVMGRLIDDKWTTCRDIEVPWSDQILFRPLPGRIDVSSTELRAV